MGDDWVRKLLWGLLGLGAIVFMIGFGSCAALGFSFGVKELTSAWGMQVFGLAVIGTGLAWGFFKLARYCARQISTGDDADKAQSP